MTGGRNKLTRVSNRRGTSRHTTHGRKSRSKEPAESARGGQERDLGPGDGTGGARSDRMAPPKGSVGADGGGQQMAFRRAKSTGGNATAEQARAALVRAFESADLDRSGMIGACPEARAFKTPREAPLSLCRPPPVAAPFVTPRCSEGSELCTWRPDDLRVLALALES